MLISYFPLFSFFSLSFAGWHILQALTGRVAGDDWDLSHNGVDVTTMKSSYPHKEGRWAWEGKMDFSMLMVRNPYHTLQAYQNIRHELEYSVNWIKSFSRVKDVYTATSPVEEWIIWRDSLFEKELKAWVSPMSVLCNLYYILCYVP